MWQHKELHEMFRRNGLDESHFYCSTTGTLSSSRSASKMSTLKHSPMGESATVCFIILIVYNSAVLSKKIFKKLLKIEVQGR